MLNKAGTFDEIVTNNRIITNRLGTRYFIRYILGNKVVQHSDLPYFIVSMTELTQPSDYFETILKNGSAFTLREESVIKYAAAGLTNKEIGDILLISPFTVQNHLQHIYEKTGLKNRAQLATIAKNL